MASFLVHVTTGPDDPTKAALAFLVAATAAKGGHSVTMFIAGEGVSLFRPGVASSLEGKGTGRLEQHLAALSEAGVRLYLSGMSANARGLERDEVISGHSLSF